MSRIAVRGTQRFESPLVCSYLKSNDSNRKAQNRSIRCEGVTLSLGGHFGPDKKDLAAPPPPKIPCRHPPGPLPALSSENPPRLLLGFLNRN